MAPVLSVDVVSMIRIQPLLIVKESITIMYFAAKIYKRKQSSFAYIYIYVQFMYGSYFNLYTAL